MEFPYIDLYPHNFNILDFECISIFYNYYRRSWFMIYPMDVFLANVLRIYQDDATDKNVRRKIRSLAKSQLEIKLDPNVDYRILMTPRIDSDSMYKTLQYSDVPHLMSEITTSCTYFFNSLPNTEIIQRSIINILVYMLYQGYINGNDCLDGGNMLRKYTRCLVESCPFITAEERDKLRTIIIMIPGPMMFI